MPNNSVDLRNSPPKQFVFDLGGVLLNINIDLTVQAFDQIAASSNGLPFSTIYSKKSQNELMDRFEKGLISAAAFKEGIEDSLKIKISFEVFEKAWNALLLDFPSSRLQALKKLRAKFPIHLLSNTNEVHVKRINADLQSIYQIKDLDSLFEKSFYSYKMKQRKPDAEIYESVLDAIGEKAEDVLFIDDNKANIEAAAEVGLKVIHLGPGMEITQVLSPIVNNLS